MAWSIIRSRGIGTNINPNHSSHLRQTFIASPPGVSFRHLLSVVQPKPEAKYVLFESYDEYTTNLPLSVCDDDDVFLVHTWNHRPLSRDHGGPVRMIIPKRYAWKGAKWIKKMTFSEKDQKGFWEVRGYSNTALPWNNDRHG